MSDTDYSKATARPVNRAFTVLRDGRDYTGVLVPSQAAEYDRLKRVEKYSEALAFKAYALENAARAILDADKDNPESGQEPRK